MIYGDYYDDTELLKEITEAVEVEFNGLNMMWAYKEHDDSILIPDGFDDDLTNDDEKGTSDDIFKKLYPDFEKNHAKIINSSSYVKELPNKVIVMSKTQLVHSYVHIELEFKTNLRFRTSAVEG